MSVYFLTYNDISLNPTNLPAGVYQYALCRIIVLKDNIHNHIFICMIYML